MDFDTGETKACEDFEIRTKRISGLRMLTSF